MTVTLRSRSVRNNASNDDRRLAAVAGKQHRESSVQPYEESRRILGAQIVELAYGRHIK